MTNNASELVSVIMPSYNTSEYIEQSIKSVINQTYQNWELIIVDDCSNDKSVDKIKSFSDSRIHLICNPNNLGAAVSRNRALMYARGKWVAFLDSDDIWEKNKLEMQIDFMKNNKIHFSYTEYEEIDSAGKTTGVLVTGPELIKKRKMFDYCWVGCLTVMYDQEFVGKIQIENIKKNNDYAMWLKICKKADCYLLKQKLAYYRRGRNGSISSHSVFQLVKWHYLLFRNAEKLGVIPSINNTICNIIFGIYKKIRYVKKV